MASGHLNFDQPTRSDSAKTKPLNQCWFNPFNAGNNFRRKNLRFGRLKTVPVLKKLKTLYTFKPGIGRKV